MCAFDGRSQRRFNRDVEGAFGYCAGAKRSGCSMYYEGYWMSPATMWSLLTLLHRRSI